MLWCFSICKQFQSPAKNLETTAVINRNYWLKISNLNSKVNSAQLNRTNTWNVRDFNVILLITWKEQSENCTREGRQHDQVLKSFTAVSKPGTCSAKQEPARDMWAPRKANNLAEKPLWGSRDQIGNDFQINYFMYGNLRLLAAQFQLFQWRLDPILCWWSGQLLGWPAPVRSHR